MINNRLHPVNNSLVSDELYEKSIGKINKAPLDYTLSYKTRVIHLIDSVSRGYTSPMEAYEALGQTYFPIVLECRESAYKHLL
jgi:hypothetical protein